CTTFHSMPGNLRPTHVPAPLAQACCVSLSTSLAAIDATGNDSVAPYGVCTSPAGAMHAFIRANTCGGTGAPAESTRASVGNCTPCSWQYSPTRFQIAGEPNACVTFQS